MLDHQLAIRRYLDFVLTSMKLSPRQLALRAGIAPTTITRFLNSESQKFTISNSTLSKIAKVTGISPAAFFAMTDMQLERSVVDLNLLEIEDQTSPDLISEILYEVSPGYWMEEDIYARLTPLRDIGLPQLHAKDDTFYALVHGDSIEQYVLPGEYLFCKRVRWGGQMSSLKDGQLYIIERRSGDGKLVECSARIAAISQDEVIFRFASNNPRYEKTTLRFDATALHAGEMQVVGLACSVVRRLALKV